MIHPASRLEVVVHSRADGRSAVKSAAYTARTSYRDERLGQRFRAGKRGGLLSHELINWNGDAETLWNAAEHTETRRNARVIRELRPSLPAELPLAEQERLVRGFSLWLRDQYGVAVQADIHAPRFLDRDEERRHNAGKLATDAEEYLAALFDPTRTNRNFHAHMLLTTRKVCPETGAFGDKTRILDDKKTGPEEILRIRREWEKRTNAALKRIGSPARVDLRSYKDMVKAGDAPAGLIPQDHLGPRRAERSRRLEEDGGDTSTAGQRRAEIREHNDELWRTWLQLRALQREQDRLEESARIAAEREAERKEKADAERRRLQDARTAAEAEAVVEASAQFDSVRTASMWELAISSAQGLSPEPPCEEPDEFSAEVDLETYEPPQGRPQPEPVLTPKVVRVRRRGPRHL
ncbi:MobA/MobL family protein [Phaeobacter sp. JH85H1]|uniref:MobA/MobL family protein n=1 Tax=unclassified Phaeobacter TaxID=2621772 RepID=UPI003A8A69B3